MNNPDYLIEEFYVEKRQNQFVDFAFDVITGGERFNTEAWARIEKAVEIATGYYINIEGYHPGKATGLAIEKVFHYAAIKAIVEEQRLRKALTEEELDVLYAEDDRRNNFEQALLDYVSELNLNDRNNNRRDYDRMRDDRHSNRFGSSRDRYVDRNDENQGQAYQNSLAKRNKSINFNPEQTQRRSFDDVADSKQNSPAAGRAKQFTKAKVEEIEKSKEGFAVSSDLFNVKNYPDHRPLSFKTRDSDAKDYIEAYMDHILKVSGKELSVFHTDTDSEEVMSAFEGEEAVYISDAVNLQSALRQARAIKNDKEKPLLVFATVEKPIVTLPDLEFSNFLINFPIQDIDKCKDFHSLMSKLVELRKDPSTEAIAINAVISKIANIAVNDVINAAIPTRTFSPDVIGDWEKIYASIINYSKKLSNNAKAIFDNYLKETYPSFLARISCIVTKSPEQLKALAAKWDLEEGTDSLFQSNTVALLDIPITSGDLGIYVNTNADFIVDERAGKFNDTLKQYIEILKAYEELDFDFMYVSFAESSIYRITTDNKSSDRSVLILSEVTDLI